MKAMVQRKWAESVKKTKYFSHCVQKIFKFFTTLSVLVCMSGQAFMVIAPHRAADYSL